MQNYSDIISLIKNSRGVYDLDTSKGCFSGMSLGNKGCYGECYAARQSRQYGYNFCKTTLRNFENIKHIELIRKQIYEIDMPFIRIGVTGDPSENWSHCLSIINLVSGIKPIVLITKHWKDLTNSQLKEIEKYNVCINTSVSALDENNLLNQRLKQYEILKNHCKSILRIVSCDFNKTNLTGLFLNEIQNNLFKKEKTLDNIFRASLNNKYVKMNIIKVKKEKFLTKESYFSKNNKNTYTGSCEKCPDMCGINI